VLLQVKGDAVTPAAKVDDPHIFSVAIDAKGAVLVGTGGLSGRVLRYEREGGKLSEKPKELFKADGVQYVWAIRQTPDGNLYAATGPGGQLFEIKPEGSHRVLLDTDENNLLSLVSDGKDTLYVGTDPNGLVYRVNRKTGESFILYDASEAEVTALALDAKGNLYAGTAEARDDVPAVPQMPATGAEAGRPEAAAGIAIPSNRPNEPEPPKVPDPTPGQPDPIPKGIIRTPAPTQVNNGAVRAVAAGVDAKRGAKPRATPDVPGIPGDDPTPPPNPPTPGPTPGPHPQPGKPEPVPGPGTPAPTPQTPDANVPGRLPPVNTLPTGQPRPEGNAVYRIDPDGFVTEIFRQPLLVLALVEKNGTLLIATGGPTEGQIYQVNPAAEETIVLAKVNPKQVLSLLPTSDGRIYMGLANVGGIATLSPGFAAEGKYTSPVLDAQQVSRFGNLQLHGALPQGTGLKVATRSGNVRDSAQKSWSDWSEEAAASEFVKIASPPARFLQYRLTFTSAEGGKVSPVVEDVSVAYQMPNLPPQIKSVKITPTPDAAAQSALGGGDVEPVRIPATRKQMISWEAVDANGDALVYSLYFRRGSSAPWILMKEKVREAQFEWDTRSVADGRYDVKVVASDAFANPPGKGRTAARVSDPVLVDNTPPMIGDLKWARRGASVHVDLTVVDRTSVVAALDYAIDSSREWQAVLPSDNIFDGPEEKVSFTVSGLTAGTHQLTLRATDAKGNQAFENVFVQTEAPAARVPADR